MTKITKQEIIKAREMIGLNMREMAEIVGVSYSGYVKWERGEREPDNIAQQALKMTIFLHKKGLLEEFRGKKPNEQKLNFDCLTERVRKLEEIVLISSS